MSVLTEDRITSADRARMFDHVLGGAKPRSEWRTGLELELIGFELDGMRRIGIAAIEALLAEYSDDPIIDAGVLVGASAPAGSLTVEPGGQVEFSGSPEESLSVTEAKVTNYIDWLREQSRALGIIFLGIGFDPLRSLGDMRWVEKPRYSIMRPYLEGKDLRGLDMMTRTASIQVNLDFDSLEDLGKKFVAGNRLAPIATAIFANSPFREGRPSGVKSERSLVWLETDGDRCGISRAVLSRQFSLDEWLDDILSTPMFFIRRNDAYRNMTGTTFKEFLDNPVDATPLFGDFVDHLTTVFTEARLKRWIEMRSADGGGVLDSLAVQAFWKGLLYDPASLGEAIALVPGLNGAEYLELQREVAVKGLSANTCGVRVLDLARDLVGLSRAGLAAQGKDEAKYLDVVVERLGEGICPADILIRNFEGSWQGQIGHAIDYLRLA
ncbi:MAG: glutamate-cysteine ligase family protein [Acidobacteriota bacterium]